MVPSTTEKQRTALVRTSGTREKLRSNALKALARERGGGGKKRKLNAISGQNDQGDPDEDDDDDYELDRLEKERQLERAKKSSTSSLLSVLPEPKNSSAFGPTIKLDKLLKMPERADLTSTISEQTPPSPPVNRLNQGTDGEMIEVDMSKLVDYDPTPSSMKSLTIEKSDPSRVVNLPKGREKQKNQITYLAQLGKATELERKEQAAQSRVNKAAARSKYGW